MHDSNKCFELRFSRGVHGNDQSIGDIFFPRCPGGGANFLYLLSVSIFEQKWRYLGHSVHFAVVFPRVILRPLAVPPPPRKLSSFNPTLEKKNWSELWNDAVNFHAKGAEKFNCFPRLLHCLPEGNDFNFRRAKGKGITKHFQQNSIKMCHCVVDGEIPMAELFHSLMRPYGAPVNVPASNKKKSGNGSRWLCRSHHCHANQQTPYMVIHYCNTSLVYWGHKREKCISCVGEREETFMALGQVNYVSGHQE